MERGKKGIRQREKEVVAERVLAIEEEEERMEEREKERGRF